MISDQDHAMTAGDNGSPAVLSQVYQLTNNRGIVRFEMPDMLAFANGSFEIPNQFQADIYTLIKGDGSFATAVEQLNYDNKWIRGLYALFSIVCVEPKFVLDDEDRKSNEIGPRNVSWTDILVCYNFFRFGPFKSLSTPAREEPELVTPTDVVTETSE